MQVVACGVGVKKHSVERIIRVSFAGRIRMLYLTARQGVSDALQLRSHFVALMQNSLQYT